MKKGNSTWMKNPSRTQLTLFTLLSIFGIGLLVLVVTDLFTENPFKRKYLMLYFLAIGSAIATTKLHLNYWKNNKA